MITYYSRASFFAAAKGGKGFGGLSTASSINSDAQKCIQDIFRTLQGTRFSMPLTQRIKIELVRKFVSIECLKSEVRENQFKTLFKSIELVPITEIIDERVHWFHKHLDDLPVMPVMMPLSTQVFSNEVPYILYDTTQLALSLNQSKSCHDKYKELKVALLENMHLLAHNKLLSNQSFMPSEALETEHCLYQNKFESRSEFHNTLIDAFVKVHGGEREYISTTLKPAMMRLSAHDDNSLLKRIQQERAQSYLSRSDIYSKSTDEILKQLLQSIDGELGACAEESADLLSPIQQLRECIDAFQKRPNAQTEENIILACVGIQQAQQYKALTGQISCGPKYAFR